jgi:hypothetical protein
VEDRNHALQLTTLHVFTKLKASTDNKGLKNGKGGHKHFCEIFWLIGLITSLSTIETMSGRLRTAPKPPPKPSNALRGFYHCQRLPKSIQICHQNHWKWSDGCAQVSAPRLTWHKWCAWRWIQLLLQHQQDLKNITIKTYYHCLSLLKATGKLTLQTQNMTRSWSPWLWTGNRLKQ